MALGATAGDVHQLVVWRGLGLALVGTVAGMAAVLASHPLLSVLLFEVSPSDSVTLVTVTGLMLGLAAAASLGPARMGSRTDPVTALRSET
jgi:ABC-type lipoprotein release transport system permease subunit